MIWLTPLLIGILVSGALLNLPLSAMARDELKKRDIPVGKLTLYFAISWDNYLDRMTSGKVVASNKTKAVTASVGRYVFGPIIMVFITVFFFTIIFEVLTFILNFLFDSQ